MVNGQTGGVVTTGPETPVDHPQPTPDGAGETHTATKLVRPPKRTSRWVRWVRWFRRPTPTNHSGADHVRAAVADAQERMRYQDNPALLHALTDAEIKDRQEVHREIREVELGEYRASKLAEVSRTVAERQLEQELAQQSHDDRLWFRRALSGAQRLTSHSARTARLYRSYQLQLKALIATAVIGVLWGAVNVQGSVVELQQLTWNEDLAWYLAFGIEPLVTVPLIVLMMYQATLSEWGKRTSWREQWPLRTVEVALLLVIIAMNVLPHLDEGAGAIIYAIPSIMITVSMIMIPVVSGQLGQLLLKARELLAAEEAGVPTAAEADRSAGTTSAGQHDNEPAPSETTAVGKSAGPVSTDPDRSEIVETGPVEGREELTSEPTATSNEDPKPQVADRSAAGRETGDRSASANDSRPAVQFAQTIAPTGRNIPTARSATGPQPVSPEFDRLPSESGSHRPESTPSRPVSVPVESEAEQTAVLDDQSIIENYLEPVAYRLRDKEDWLTRADVMNLLGAGAGRASRLLVKLNERQSFELPKPQPRRRDREWDINEALEALKTGVTVGVN